MPWEADLKERADSERVSPTAYATGYFWYRQGLSHKGLLIPEGERHDLGFQRLLRLLRLFGVHFDALMLARHVGIDTLLARQVESGAVTQVVELAAGLSPRGWRFCKRFPQLAYVETDLPHMAALKRRLLDASQLGSANHRIVAVNALKDDGADSLAALARTLDPAGGVAIITEGLMSYLDPPAAQALWSRIARTLKHFPRGVYFSDSYVRTDRYGLAGKVFRAFIQRAVGGKMHIHFESPAQAERLLAACGFASVTLHRPDSIPETQAYAAQRGANRVRVLEAFV